MGNNIHSKCLVKNIEDSSEWRLTPDEIRQFKDFKTISDEEANKIIDTLVLLALANYETKNINIEK